MLFKKKKKNGGLETLVLDEQRQPAVLPPYGQKLESFSASDFSANDVQTLADFYRWCTERLKSLLNATDKYTDPSVADAWIDGQVEHFRQLKAAQKARHQNQCARIRAAIETRLATLRKRVSELTAKETQLKERIEPLKELSPKWELPPVFGHRISFGAVATLLFMVIDFCLNFAFMKKIMFEDYTLLFLTTVGLSVLSDGTMYMLGSMVSRRDEYIAEHGRAMYRAFCVILPGLFVLSSVATLLIRLGTIDQVFGTIDKNGRFIAGEYGIAHYTVQIITSLVPAGTGILSYIFSLDPNEHKVAQRYALEKELLRVQALLETTTAELNTLQQAEDPAVMEAQLDEAAEAQIEALRKGLKLHVRQLLAEKGDPEYTERLARSARELNEEPVPFPSLYALKNVQ